MMCGGQYVWPKEVNDFQGFPTTDSIIKETVSMTMDGGIDGVDEDGIQEVLE